MIIPTFFLRSINFLNLRVMNMFACGLLTGVSAAQDQNVPMPQEGQIIPEGYREVIKEAVIQKNDHTITMREVVPPIAVAKPEEPVSTEQPENVNINDILPSRFMMVTATFFDEKATLMEWMVNGEKFQVWSSANFQHLEGLVQFESQGVRFSIMVVVTKGVLPQGSANELSKQQRLILDAPTNQSLGEQPLLVSGSPNNDEAMDLLNGIHDYYHQNQTALTAAYETKILEQTLAPQQQAQQPKQDTTVTYWKYHKPSAK